MAITEFRGKYQFLSNFYRVRIEIDGQVYFSVENAYQAMKTLDRTQRVAFLYYTPGQAQKRGRQLEIRPDWDDVKLGIMYTLLTIKFENKYMRELLLATTEDELIEGNYWGDTYWGVCKGVGENHLGKLLMKVREVCKEQGL